MLVSETAFDFLTFVAMRFCEGMSAVYHVHRIVMAISTKNNMSQR